MIQYTKQNKGPGMKTEIYDMLTPELKTISTLFRKHTIAGYYKPLYKSWQNLLNAYLTTYTRYELKDKQELSRKLLNSLTSFCETAEHYPRYVENNNILAHKAIQNISNYVYEYTYGIIENVEKRLKTKTLANINTIIVKKPNMNETTQMKSTEIKTRVQKKAVKTSAPVLNKNIPIKLTIDGKSVDMTPLLKIPEVEKFLAEQQVNIQKSKNRKKATELANEIKALGFDIDFK